MKTLKLRLTFVCEITVNDDYDGESIDIADDLDYQFISNSETYEVECSEMVDSSIISLR